MSTTKESNQDWYVHIPHWIVILKAIDWADRAILSIIANFQSRHKPCFLSNAKFAERIQITPRNLIKRLEKLEEMGFLSRIQTKKGRYLKVIIPESPILLDEDMPMSQTTSPHVANDIPPMSQTTPKTKDKTKYKTKDLKHIGHSSNDAGKGYTKGFDNFWSNYPKRVAKADAFKAFKTKAKERSVKHEEFADFLIKHIEQRCKTEWKGKERKYIPNAASFLRQERWEDDLSYTNDIATDKPAAYTNRFRTHLYDSQPAKVPGLDNMELNVYEHE